MKSKVVPEFVVGSQDAATATQKIMGVLPLDLYLVNFSDSEGTLSTRVVMQPKNTNAVFNIQEKIAGMFVATEASGWFKNGFNQFIKKEEGIKSV